MTQRRYLQALSAVLWLCAPGWIYLSYGFPFDAWWNTFWTPVAIWGCAAIAALAARPATWPMAIFSGVSGVLWVLVCLTFPSI